MAGVDVKFFEFRGEQVQFWLLRYAVGAVTWWSSPTIEPTPLLWRAFWGRKEVCGVCWCMCDVCDMTDDSGICFCDMFFYSHTRKDVLHVCHGGEGVI